MAARPINQKYVKKDTLEGSSVYPPGTIVTLVAYYPSANALDDAANDYIILHIKDKEGYKFCRGWFFDEQFEPYVPEWEVGKRYYQCDAYPRRKYVCRYVDEDGTAWLRSPDLTDEGLAVAARDIEHFRSADDPFYTGHLNR